MKWFSHTELKERIADDLDESVRPDEPTAEARENAQLLVDRAGRARFWLLHAAIGLLHFVVSVGILVGTLYHIHLRLPAYQLSYILLLWIVLGAVWPFFKVLRVVATRRMYDRFGESLFRHGESSDMRSGS